MKTMKTETNRRTVRARASLAAASAVALSLVTNVAAAQAAITTDPSGDIFATYTGPKTSANSFKALDILDVEAVSDGVNVTLTLDVDGAVQATDSEGFYVWGVDRGKGSDRFANSPEGKGTLFDFTVSVRADGTAMYNDLILGGGPKTLGSNFVGIKGALINVTVPLSLMPSQNAAPADYAYTLWTRANSSGATDGPPQLFADFAPRITAAAVPEPATWALLIAGFGGVGATARRRRPPPQAA